MVRAVLSIAWLLIALVGSNQIPQLIADYEQIVAARLTQAIEGNAGFREIIDRFHGGDVEAYIAHHLESDDPTFRAEGEVLTDNFAAEIRLMQEYETLFNGGFASDLFHIAVDGREDILATTWALYRPAFSYAADSIIFTLVAGLALWVVPIFIWALFSRLMAER